MNNTIKASILDKCFRYVSVDQNGDVYAYEDKPERGEECWEMPTNNSRWKFLYNVGYDELWSVSLTELRQEY